MSRSPGGGPGAGECGAAPRRGGAGALADGAALAALGALLDRLPAQIADAAADARVLDRETVRAGNEPDEVLPCAGLDGPHRDFAGTPRRFWGAVRRCGR